MSDIYAELDAKVARVYADVPKTIVIPNGALVFVIGLSGSGKTTFALKHFPLECIVTTDMLRSEISNNAHNQVVSPEAFVLAGGIVKERLSRGRTSVVDAKNLDSNARSSFMRIARACGAPIVAIVLDVPARECVVRDALRVRQVGARAILPDDAQRERALYALVVEGDVVVYRLDASSVTTASVELEHAESYKSLSYFFDSDMVEKLYLGCVERNLRVKEQTIGRYIVLGEGGVLLLEYDSPCSEIFLRRNFLPYQVFDVRVLQQRLGGASACDDVVLEMLERLLSARTRLNLASVVSVPKEYSRIDDVQSMLIELQKKRGYEISVTHIMEGVGIGDQLASARIRIDRAGWSDEKLLIIGDVQGCLNSLLFLLRDVEPDRRVIFVGDMSDRGPYDAPSAQFITGYVANDNARALLVRGNHDDNLLRGLRGEDPGSHETAKTIAELKALTSERECNRIADVIESMPHIAQWKHVVVAHATLPHVPRRGEIFSKKEIYEITHGIGTGQYSAGQRKVWNLVNSCAHDPDVLVVSGHTHEQKPVVNTIAGAVILDIGVESRGKLFGLRWPEMTLHFAEEKHYDPVRDIRKNNAILRGQKLPSSGRRLRALVDYAASNGYVVVKKGKGEYDGLLVVAYSDRTEATGAWSEYPALRHFRGLIIDEYGTIIARPFAKTHKCGVEIPLEELPFPPKSVFEKVNGTLVVLYHWEGKIGVWNKGWRFSTKFSFENEYTKAAKELLACTDYSKLDKRKTYLFELILPEDPHIVDYKGERSLVLLNAINTASGKYAKSHFVNRTALFLDVRTPRDATPLWPGMSIASIYRSAQTDAAFENFEGFMAMYVDGNGREHTVKIKVRSYDDRKFIRDMKWEKLIASFDFATLDVPLSKRIQLLWYNVSNRAVREMLEERIAWIRNTYVQVIKDARDLVEDGLIAATERLIESSSDSATAFRDALGVALPLVASKIKEKYGTITKEVLNPHMGFIRSALSKKGNPADAIQRFALKEIESAITKETEKRGKCDFWLIPE